MIRIDRMDPRLVLAIGIIYGIVLALCYMPREKKVTLVFAGTVTPDGGRSYGDTINAFETTGQSPRSRAANDCVDCA